MASLPNIGPARSGLANPEVTAGGSQGGLLGRAVSLLAPRTPLERLGLVVMLGGGMFALVGPLIGFGSACGILGASTVVGVTSYITSRASQAWTAPAAPLEVADLTSEERQARRCKLFFANNDLVAAADLVLKLRKEEIPGFCKAITGQKFLYKGQNLPSFANAVAVSGDPSGLNPMKQKAQEFEACLMDNSFHAANELVKKLTEDEILVFVKALSGKSYLHKGQSALHSAVEKGCNSLVNILSRMPIDLNSLKNKKRLTPLDLAVFHGSKDLVALLMKVYKHIPYIADRTSSSPSDVFSSMKDISLSIFLDTVRLGALDEALLMAKLLGKNEIAQMLLAFVNESEGLKLLSCELSIANSNTPTGGSSPSPLSRFGRNRLFEPRVLGLVSQFLGTK